jgi:hypothetical protein
LLTLVSDAHAHDTPAVSPVRRTRAICGRNCGTANTVATTGSQSSTSARLWRSEASMCAKKGR